MESLYRIRRGAPGRFPITRNGGASSVAMKTKEEHEIQSEVEVGSPKSQGE